MYFFCIFSNLHFCPCKTNCFFRKSGLRFALPAASAASLMTSWQFPLLLITRPSILSHCSSSVPARSEDGQKRSEDDQSEDDQKRRMQRRSRLRNMASFAKIWDLGHVLIFKWQGPTLKPPNNDSEIWDPQYRSTHIMSYFLSNLTI